MASRAFSDITQLQKIIMNHQLKVTGLSGNITQAIKKAGITDSGDLRLDAGNSPPNVYVLSKTNKKLKITFSGKYILSHQPNKEFKLIFKDASISNSDTPDNEIDIQSVAVTFKGESLYNKLDDLIDMDD